VPWPDWPARAWVGVERPRGPVRPPLSPPSSPRPSAFARAARSTRSFAVYCPPQPD